MGTKAGNIKARKRGYASEQYAVKKYRLKSDTKQLIDVLTEGGRYIEIKSCDVKSGNAPGKQTSGRFIFNKAQHKHLLKHNGEYLFIVHHGKDILCEKLEKASTLEQKFRISAQASPKIRWNLIC